MPSVAGVDLGACRRRRRPARRSTRGCRAGRPGTPSRSNPSPRVAHHDADPAVGRRASTDDREALAAGVLHGVGDRLRRGQHEGAARRGRGSRRRPRPMIARRRPGRRRARARRARSRRRRRRHRTRLVAALAGVLLGVGEPRERLARHRDGERPLARRLGALGGDERGQHAVVHQRGDRDALLLRGIRRGRLRVRGDRPRARLVDVRGDRAEHPAERQDARRRG